MVIIIFVCTDSKSTTTTFFFSLFFVIHGARDMEMPSSMEPALFLSPFTDMTFHIDGNDAKSPGEIKLLRGSCNRG